MTTATVCIPWRPSPSRIKPYEAVRKFWEQEFPDWPIITADSNSDIFNLGAARNNAVRQAKTPVVVVCDADTIPPADSVRAAADNPVGVTWPHKTWRLIPREWAEKPVTELRNAPPIREHRNGLGGTIITTRQEWWRLGGAPEEFVGWGFEDRAFNLVARTLSSARRIGGVAYSFDHDSEPGWERDRDDNAELAEPYQRAAGRPWLMRQLLAARDGTDEPFGDRGSDNYAR